MASKRNTTDPQGARKRELARLVAQLRSSASALLCCYEQPLLENMAGTDWVEARDGYFACPEWVSHNSHYFVAGTLARNIIRLAAALGHTVEALFLADLAAALATGDAPDLAALEMRDSEPAPHSTEPLKRLDDRLEPMRSLQLGLHKAMIGLDLLDTKVSGTTRTRSLLLRERAAKARSIRASHPDRPWAQIVDEVEGIYPKSLGLPPLTESNLRASMSRSAANPSNRKPNTHKES